MATRKLLRLGLGLGLAALFLWLIMRRVEYTEVSRVFAASDIRWIAAALVAFAFGYICRIERWRVMLMRDSPQITWRACAGPFMGSFAANNVLPFRAGDVLRSFAFNAKLGASPGVVIATLLTERLLDLVMVLALLGVAFAAFGTASIELAAAGSAVVFAGASVIVLVLYFPRPVVRFASVAGRYASRFSPKLGSRIGSEVQTSLSTVRHLTSGETLIRVLSLSMVVWLAEGCVFWFSALAIPSIKSPLASWVALPVGTLATLIPSTPGYVGTFDYFTMQAMTGAGNDMASTAAYALLVHALLWAPTTLIGGFYLLFRRS